MTNFDQRSQTVDKQYNAGRDQIIQNIVIVGKFLKFAEIEKLIPKTSNLSVEQINSILEKRFSGIGGGNLAEATAFAGEILREILIDWRPNQPFVAIRTRNVLTEIAPKIINKLKQLGYWDTFYEKSERLITWREENILGSLSNGEIEVIWLDSIEKLWHKYFGNSKRYGLARVSRKREYWFIKKIESFDIFVVNFSASTIIRPAYNPNKPLEKHYDFTNMKSEEFRIFMAGLVIDLIRIRSTTSDNIKLWDELINLVK